MATGLKIPVGVNPMGGIAKVTGDDNAIQAIKTALTDCENEHAFQQELGLGAGMVFASNDMRLRAVILRRVRGIFNEFQKEKRFKLLEETIKWSEGDGELVLEFRYMDLESDEEKPFQRVFRPEE